MKFTKLLVTQPRLTNRLTGLEAIERLKSIRTLLPEPQPPILTFRTTNKHRKLVHVALAHFDETYVWHRVQGGMGIVSIDTEAYHRYFDENVVNFSSGLSRSWIPVPFFGIADELAVITRRAFIPSLVSIFTSQTPCSVLYSETPPSAT